ncbi:MAG: NUDIX hydrolase [Chloroflexi bacterium]|nr:NUDIX hydrolase [Chloroflexota bacterium]
MTFENTGTTFRWDETPPAFQVQLDVSRNTHYYWTLSRSKRVAEVVLLLQRPNGRFLVHTKGFYPAGTWRLMTGGVHPGEDPADAALREADEETGLVVRLERPLARIDYEFLNEAGTLTFTSYLYLLRELGGALGALDDSEAITGYREVSLDEFEPLAEQLEALQGDDWADWGRFRAAAHRIAHQLLAKEQDETG